MMMSSIGNIFRVTGYLCGEFPGHRRIPHTKASDTELWYFLWSAPESGDLRRHRAHYDVMVMTLQSSESICRIINHMKVPMDCSIWSKWTTMIKSIFYHDVDEIFWPQPIRSLQLGHVTGQGTMSPTWVGPVSDPGRNGFHKKYKNLHNITVYLIASLKSNWKKSQIKNMKNWIW